MFLSRIQTIVPPHRLAQNDSFAWLASNYVAHQSDQSNSEDSYRSMLKRVGCPETQIAQRFFFQRGLSEPTSDRQKKFQHFTNDVFETLYQAREIPENLIHVSCTGYGSPSGAQRIAARKSPDTVVTHSYHMGCYGAFPALRMAVGFLSTQKHMISASADVVHTELCTLHMNPKDPTLEQMVIQSLFADGVAAYNIAPVKPNQPSLEIIAVDEFIVPDTADAMTWSIGDLGMAMTLSKDVPTLIGRYLREAILKWEKKTGEAILPDISKTQFAIHPGGPKIIDAVQNLLELSESQIRFSREVLRDHGNMSSATVPHIWKKLIDDESIADGTKVISMAFGPGLTLCLSLMRLRR